MTGTGKIIDNDVREKLKSDFGRSYLVDAGAGTGKTTVLVDRLIGAVEAGYDLERVAAVTFTEKAAGELILRVRQKIEEKINESSDPDKWKSAREKLERTHIGTIHSFCAFLLRKRPIEAGVDPNFEVMDEVGARLLKEEAWKEWIGLQLDSGEDEWGWLVKVLLKEGVTLKKLRETAFGLVEKREVFDSFMQSMSEPKTPDTRALIANVNNAFNKARRLVEEYCTNKENDSGAGQLKEKEEEWLKLAPNSGSENFCVVPYKINKNKLGAQANWKPKERKKEFASILKNIEKTVNDYNKEVGDYYVKPALKWLHGFTGKYEEKKAEQGRLDFEDLLIKSRDMLANLNGKEVRAYFQNLFDLILVDEFQDTDPLQVEVVLLLSESKPEAERWNEARPQKGKLFIVGDPKQSIYRFRRADVHTYLQVKNCSEKALSQKELAQNFRSAAPLMDFFNSFFDEHFNSNPETGGAIHYIELKPAPGYSKPPGEMSRPGVVGLEVKGIDFENKPKAEQIRTAEAEHVSRLIRRAVEDGWLVRNKNNKWRPMGYGDIAVLFLKRTGLYFFSEALGRHGISYVAPGAAGLFSGPESRSLISCLSAIDRPDDGVALVGALRSPFFGFTDESIATARLKKLELNYLVAPDSGKFPDFARAFEILRQLHDEKNELPKARIISRLLEDTGAIALYSQRDPSRMATISRFQQLARDFDYSVGGSLRSFIGYLAELESESQAEEAVVESEESNEVSLMTVHGAKGLEFPMVILGDMTVAGKFDEKIIIDRRDNSVSVRFGDGLRSQNWEEKEAQEKSELKQEEARLLYVACTRARDYLVVPMPQRGETKGFTAPVIRHIREKWTDKTHFPEILPIEVAAARKQATTALKCPAKGGTEPNGMISLNEWKEHRKGVLDKLSRPARFKTVTGTKPEIASPAEKPRRSDGDSHGRRLGIFVHRLMEKIDLARPPDTEAVETLARQLLLSDPDLPSGMFRAAVEMARRALDLPVIRRAARSPKVKKEFPVLVKSGDGGMISGVADLVFEENGKLVLADYKTDSVADEREAQALMKEKYARQGLEYAAALEKAVGMEVREALILFLHPSPAIEMPCK